MASSIVQIGYNNASPEGRGGLRKASIPAKAKHFNDLVTVLEEHFTTGTTGGNATISNYLVQKPLVVLSGGGSTTLTANQSGAVCIFDTAATSTFVLPAAQLGLTFTFISAILATGDHVVQAPTNDHGFLGGVISVSTTAAKGQAFGAAVDGNNDFITMTGGTTGGAPGSRIEVVCILGTSAAKTWAVTGQIAAVGSSTATPFGDAQL